MLITAHDVEFLRGIEQRLARLEPGARMLLSRKHSFWLSSLAALPRHSREPYESYTTGRIRFWLNRAKVNLVDQVVTSLTAT